MKRQARWAASACFFATVVLSLAPAETVPSDGIGDKWGHALAYAATAVAAHIGWYGRHRPYHLVAALVVAGAVIEMIQGLVGRHPDLADIGANAVGALFGVGIGALTATLVRDGGIAGDESRTGRGTDSDPGMA